MSGPPRAARIPELLFQLDRRWIFLVVLLCVVVPIVLPIGLPVTTTVSTQHAFDFIEALKPGDVVLISFDYGPSSAPENDPMAEAVMRQCAIKKIPFVVIALWRSGGLARANDCVAKIASEFPNLEYGVDYVNLGFKDGADAVMRRMGDDIAGAFPTDVRGTPIHRIPMMARIRNLHQVSAVFTAATGVIGEYWITQVHAQAGTPVIIGPTAVSAPKYFAFQNAGQVVGMVAGMKGAAEYESLLRGSHPELAHFYGSTHDFTATKGMDVQTVLHAAILGFILIGNVAFLTSRRATR
jgi:hypothetical protein